MFHVSMNEWGWSTEQDRHGSYLHVVYVLMGQGEQNSIYMNIEDNSMSEIK